MERVSLDECRKCSSYVREGADFIICSHPSVKVNISIMPYVQSKKVIKGVYCSKYLQTTVDTAGFQARLHAGFAKKLAEIRQNKVK